MAKELGVKEVLAVANKVRTAEDLDFIKTSMCGMRLIGVISFNNSIMEADIKGVSPYKNSPETIKEIKKTSKVKKIITASRHNGNKHVIARDEVQPTPKSLRTGAAISKIKIATPSAPQ